MGSTFLQFLPLHLSNIWVYLIATNSSVLYPIEHRLPLPILVIDSVHRQSFWLKLIDWTSRYLLSIDFRQSPDLRWWHFGTREKVVVPNLDILLNLAKISFDLKLKTECSDYTKFWRSSSLDQEFLVLYQTWTSYEKFDKSGKFEEIENWIEIEEKLSNWDWSLFRWNLTYFALDQ